MISHTMSQPLEAIRNRRGIRGTENGRREGQGREEEKDKDNQTQYQAGTDEGRIRVRAPGGMLAKIHQPLSSAQGGSEEQALCSFLYYSHHNERERARAQAIYKGLLTDKPPSG